MDQTNRRGEICGATLVAPESLRSDAMTKYEELKLDGVCTRCKRVKLPDGAEVSLCPACHAKVKALKRTSAAKQRREWRRKKLCTRCGSKRRKGSKLCGGCSVDLGKVSPRFVDHLVDHQRDRSDERWAARVETTRDGVTSGYAHKRFRGQAKRGRQPAAQLDDQDLTDAKRCLDHGLEGLVYFRTDEVQSMPRVQREDVKKAALAKLRQAQRWIDEAIVRNDPKSRQAREPSDD